MRAVILAAGEGKRMRAHFQEPKPLIPLLGIPLIERNIRTLNKAGIREFVVITGKYDKEIKEYLGDGSQLGVSVTYVYNADWEQGNGVSVHAFRQLCRPGERFLLLMADHLFQEELVKEFIREADRLEEGEILLAADNRLNDVFDLEECTKVRAEGGRALELGKQLKEFQAVDCGLFVGSESLLGALSEAIHAGKHTLSDGVNILCGERKVKLFFVSGRWIDVDDPPSFKEAEKMLLSGLIPAKDGFISRTINRKFSLRLTKKLAYTRITPNQVTALSFLISLGSSLSFAFGSPLAGGLLAQISSIVDGVDGEIARLKFQKSNYGGLFDSILDRYADFLIIAGMAVAWFAEASSPYALAISALALTGLPMSMLVKEKFHALTGKQYISEEYDGFFHYIPMNRDGRLFLVFLGGLFNLIGPALAILAVLTHLQTIYRLIRIRKFMME